MAFQYSAVVKVHRRVGKGGLSGVAGLVRCVVCVSGGSVNRGAAASVFFRTVRALCEKNQKVELKDGC